jgi:MFS family permease
MTVTEGKAMDVPGEVVGDARGGVASVAATSGSLWRDRGFRRLWLGSSVSLLGSEVSELALPLLAILTLGATGAQVGALRAAQFLPFLLMTLHAGVLVDRSRRRPLMIAADLGRFLLLAAVPLAVWLGFARIELLYVLVFAAGMLTVVYQLADFAYLPTLVGRDRLVAANGRLAASQSAAEIGGRGLGGLLVGALSAPVAVLLDAVSYLVSAVSLAGIRRPEPALIRAAGRRPLRAEVVEGLRLVLGNRFLWRLLGEATTFNLFNEVFTIGLLLYAARELRLPPAAIGLAFSIGAVGAFVGAVVGARISGRFGFGVTLSATLVVGNTAPVAVVLVHGSGAATVPALGAIFLLMGFGIALANVHNVSLRQAAVAGRLHGRMNAAYRLIAYGAIPVGATLGGLLAGGLGGRAAMLIGAAGIPLATLWVVLFSPIPGLRTVPARIEL